MPQTSKNKPGKATVKPDTTVETPDEPTEVVTEAEAPEDTPEVSEDKEDTEEVEEQALKEEAEMRARKAEAKANRTKKPQAKRAELPGDGLVIAKGSFSYGGQLVKEGQIFDRDDPIIEGREHHFESVADRVRTR